MGAMIKDKTGAQAEVKLTPHIYQEALDQNLTVPQLINQKFADDTDIELYGTPYDQLAASSGLIFGKDKTFGLKPPSLGDVLSGKAMFGAATVLEGDPSSRILYPAAVLELVESSLAANRMADVDGFNSMVGLDTSVASSRVEYPILNLTNAESARSKAIAQLAEPASMLTVTTSDTTKKLPTLALGLEVSDQALQATTLDFVGRAVARQSEVEQNARVYDYLLAMLQGDTDNGQSALAQTKADTFDATIVAAGGVTKKALISWLVTNYHKRRITHIVTDLAGLFAIETAMATTNTGNFPIPGIVPQFSVVNRMLSELRIFVTDPTVASWPANTLMGLDKDWAIHRIRNSAASYRAVEQFVLRRSTVLRFDFSEICVRWYDDAFDTLSLTLTT